MSRIVFLDTETTGLDPEIEQVFEIAVIEQDGTEHVWRLEPTPAAVRCMHPKAAEVNRYFERTTAEGWKWDATQPDEVAQGDAWEQALQEISDLLDGAHIVGAVPDFDARFLAHLFTDHGAYVPRWHYHLIDVETLIIGYILGKGMPLPDLPWDSEFLSALVGVAPAAGEDRHTALGDARWVKRIWDRLEVQS